MLHGGTVRVSLEEPRTEGELLLLQQLVNERPDTATRYRLAVVNLSVQAGHGLREARNTAATHRADEVADMLCLVAPDAGTHGGVPKELGAIQEAELRRDEDVAPEASAARECTAEEMPHTVVKRRVGDCAVGGCPVAFKPRQHRRL